MRATRTPEGRLVGTTLAQDVMNAALSAICLIIVLIAVILHPPSRRTGTPGAWE